MKHDLIYFVRLVVTLGAIIACANWMILSMPFNPVITVGIILPVAWTGSTPVITR
jgi:hypothetical protein